MTDLLRRTRNPATRTRSPTYEKCSNGMENLRAKDMKNSAQNGNRRPVSPGCRLSGTDRLSVPVTSGRSRSTERPGSARTNFGIPQITVTEVDSSSNCTELNRNSDSATIPNKSRSRSASPFDWIAREKLPSGSPAFERVKSDMLSDSETSPMNSDTEHSNAKSTRVKKRTTKTAKTNSYYVRNGGKFKY